MKKATLLLMALTLVTANALAVVQNPPGGGPGGPGGPPPHGPQQGRGGNLIFIVRMPTVQTHLNLTQAQKNAIAALPPPPGGGHGGPPGGGGQGGPPPGGGGQGGPPPGGGGHGGPPPGGGGQGGPPPGGGGQGGPPPGGGNEPPNPLAEILNQQQMNRLKQLGLQFDAPMTMLDPRNAGELHLTQPQRQSIHQAIQTHMPPPQPNQHFTFAQMQSRKLAAFNAAWAILTQEQKDSWDHKVGPKFTNWVEPPRPQ